MVAPLALLPTLIPALVETVPALIRVFGKGTQSEKNAKAAELVVEAAKKATGSVNEQDLLVKLEKKDPEVVKQVNEAVREVWYEITLNPMGIEDAREANWKSEGFWKQPAFWITVLLLPLVYITTGTVLGLVPGVSFTTEVQIMVVSSIISGLLSAIAGFWLGTSWSSARKTELYSK